MKKNKKIITSIIITAIIIMIIIFAIFGNFQSEDKNQRTDDFEEYEQLEFTIDIVDCPWDLDNKSFYYQLKNISDNTFNYTGPEIGKNLNFIITAANGTKYSYAGPINMGLPYWRNLTSGEIKDGHAWFGFKVYHLYASGINYTHWQNWTKDESWFFQPGTYEIYGEYESRTNDVIENVLDGIWYSNTVTLSLE